MSFRAKRLIKKIISWSGLFFFALAAYMLYRQLSKYHLQDIQDALMSIPRQNLLYACAASFIGYVALSSYDFLALKYIGASWRPGNGYLSALSVFRSAIMRGMPLFPAALSVIVFIPAGVFMAKILSKW